MSGFSDMGSSSPLQLGCPIHRVFCDGWEVKISPAYFRLPPIRVPHVRIFGHGFFLASTTRVPHPSRLLRWVGSKNLPRLLSTATNPGAPCPDFRTWVLPRLYNSGAPSIASFAMGGKQKSPPPTFDCHQSGCPMSGFSDMGSSSPLQPGCPIHRVFCDGWEVNLSHTSGVPIHRAMRSIGSTTATATLLKGTASAVPQTPPSARDFSP